MKKILVVLLVLAVATGVFAQRGEWSVSSDVHIGSYIDFDNDPAADGEPAVVRSSGYWAPYNYWQLTTGTFGIGYSIGGLSAKLTFDTSDDTDRVAGSVQYNGENYKFQAKTNLARIINGTADVNRLWGYYKLLNEMVHLEVAYDSRDTTGGMFWSSDLTAGFYLEGSFNSPIVDAGKMPGKPTGAYKNNNAFNPASRDSFTSNNHGNFLLASVDLEGLSFGVIVPRVFWDKYQTHGNAMYTRYGLFDSADSADRDYANSIWDTDPASPTYGEYLSGARFPKATYWGSFGKGGALLVEDILKKTVFGVKLQIQPVEFAAQILMQDYGVYFGGRVFFGPLTVGLSFMGVMAPKDAAGESMKVPMRVGGSLAYDAEGFGAGISGWFGTEGDKTAANKDWKINQIGIEPYFFYNVIPTHLQFRTDVGFYFNNVYNGSEKDNDASDIIWGVQPQIFWNFLGTGAGSYWAWNTGMIVRYRLVKEDTNALDITFRFAF
jgi:hypothetical protein